jgi:hypothetical protein
LHIEGPETSEVLQSIIKKRIKTDSDIYFCTGESPWEYHFDKNNYQLLTELTPDEVNTHLNKHHFLKIAKKAKLVDWPSLNDLSIRNLQLFSRLTGYLRKF